MTSDCQKVFDFVNVKQNLQKPKTEATRNKSSPQDLPGVLDCCIKFFSDDAKLYQNVNTLVQANQLQGNVNRSETWADIWRMFFKYKKCKKFHVENRDINSTYKMHDQGQPVSLEQVEVEKDLGIYIDRKTSFRDHITKKVNIANRNLGRIFRLFTYMDKERFLQLYKSLVRPHLEYWSVIFSPTLKRSSSIRKCAKTSYQTCEILTR